MQVSALGVGMAPYYHPNFPSLFTCTYTDAATKKTIKTPGRTDAVDYAAVRQHPSRALERHCTGGARVTPPIACCKLRRDVRHSLPLIAS